MLAAINRMNERLFSRELEKEINWLLAADLKFVTTVTTSGRVKNIPAVQMFPDNNVFLCQICAKNEIYTFIW